MAFDNAIFPQVPLFHDVRRSVIDPVNIVTNGNYEKRYKRHKWERFVWEIPTQTMTNEKKEEIRQFLMQRGNSQNSFLYKDNELSVWDDVRLSYRLTGTVWGLYLPFSDSVGGNTHPMFNQDASNFTATVNGTPQSVNNYFESNGIPGMNINSANNDGFDVRLTGTAYFNVRLDSNFSDTLFALDCNSMAVGHQVGTIRLVEVHGES